MSESFMQANAMRGLDSRTAKMLDRQAWYEGTNYDHLSPWEPYYSQDSNGVVKYLPKRYRAPSVMLGMVREKVDRLRQELTGTDKWARVTVVSSDDDEGSSEMFKEQLDEFDLRKSIGLPIQDVGLKGSGILGFIVTDDGTIAPRYLETEWCDAILANQANSQKSRQVAEEYESIGIDLGLQSSAGSLNDAVLPVPDGSDGLDVIYLRYQWRVDEEIMVGHRMETVITWYRRDYLPDFTVDFEPIRVRQVDEEVKDWKPLPFEPHDFGVVPFVWIRPEGTQPGDLDGPSIINEQVLSLAKAADYSESFRQSAYEYNAFPRIWMHDTKLIDEFGSRPDGQTNRTVPIGDPGAFLRTKSSSTSGDGSASRVELLESEGDIIQKGIDHSAKLRENADRLTGLREFDRSMSLGALSGTALQRLMAPKIAVIKSYRTVIEDSLSLLWTKISIATGMGVGTRLSFSWPRIIEVSADDALAWAQTYTSMIESGLISRETAAKQMATLLSLEDEMKDIDLPDPTPEDLSSQQEDDGQGSVEEMPEED